MSIKVAGQPLPRAVNTKTGSRPAIEPEAPEAQAKQQAKQQAKAKAAQAAQAKQQAKQQAKAKAEVVKKELSASRRAALGKKACKALSKAIQAALYIEVGWESGQASPYDVETIYNASSEDWLQAYWNTLIDESGNEVVYLEGFTRAEIDCINLIAEGLDMTIKAGQYVLIPASLNLTPYQQDCMRTLKKRGYVSFHTGKAGKLSYGFTQAGLNLLGVTFQTLIDNYKASLASFKAS